MAEKTQTQAIKDMLESGRHVTPIDALNECGCFRLAARIADIKKTGLAIKTRLVKNPETGKNYAEYYI